MYVASISAAAKDSGGLALGASYTWSFTTAADSAPPTVVSTSPVELATGVPLTSKPSAKFSRAMDPATLDATTFSLMQGATVIEGNVALNPATTTATFSPTVPLDTSLVYKATITTAAQDLGGLALVSDYTWTFETAASAAAPTVVATSPVDQATNVPLDTEPSAGSIFQKIEGIGAGRLIDECGLKGARFGGIEITHRHANIMINRGGGTAADVRRLIAHVQATVEERTGYRLEPEIRFVGAF